MGADRFKGSGRHGRAHIVGVLDSGINNRADGSSAQIWSLSLRTENDGARARDRPLCRGGALPAVAEREAVLPFRRGKMRGGQRERVAAETAADAHGGQKKTLGHCGACAVQPEGRHVAVAHGKAGADALVEQIAYKGGVQRGFRELRFLQSKAEYGFLHLRLGFFPCLLAEARVLRGYVEGVAQRALRLLFAGDRGVGENRGWIGKYDAFFAAVIGFHLQPSVLLVFRF